MSEATGYCSIENVKDIFKLASDIIRIGPDTDGSDNITEAGVEDQIQDVERRIDARISFKYPVPLLVPVDDVVNQITKYQAAYDIYVIAAASRGMEVIPEVVKEWKKQAQALLKDIIDGRISLTVRPAEGAGRKVSTNHLKKIREIEVKLSGTDWSAIGYEFIIKESFIVRTSKAPDATEFRLDTDFDVNWRDGLMRRISGTSISNGQTVYCYFLYLETTEYQKSLRQQNIFTDEGYV